MTRRRISLAIVVVLLLLAVAVSYGAYRYILRQRVAAVVARVHAAGFPVTLDELDAWYEEPPAGENAADLYLAAFAAIVPSQADTALIPIEGTAGLPKRVEPFSQEMMAACARYLDLNAQALDLLHQARARSRCRYSIDLRFNLATHSSQVHAAVRLLMLDAVVSAEQNNSDKAFSATVDALASANSLQDEPVFMSQLRRSACFATMRPALERVVSRTPLTADQLLALDRALERTETSCGAIRGAVGELCRALYWLDEWSIVQGGYRGTSWLAMTQGFFWSQWEAQSGALDFERTLLLELISDMIDVRDSRFPERLERYKAVVARLDGLSAPTKRLVSELLPGLAGLGDADAYHAAVVRAERAGLALERYRFANGHYPEQLTALTPEYLPEPLLDPFDGAMLRYRVIPGGFVVYSIGRDRNDDGGDEGTEDQKAKDITFIVERPVEEGGTKNP